MNNTRNDCSQNVIKINEKSKENTGANGDIDAIYVVFRNFFAKNCLGFNEMQHKKEMLELSELILQLEDERNPSAVQSTYGNRRLL